MVQAFKLTLKPRHFKNTDYHNNNECAIAKAGSEIYPGEEVHEQGMFFAVGGKYAYSHITYSKRDFKKDAFKAAVLRFFGLNFIPVRTIEMKPIIAGMYFEGDTGYSIVNGAVIHPNPEDDAIQELLHDAFKHDSIVI